MNTYPEIYRPNKPGADPPEFPATCPVCGEDRTFQVTKAPPYLCRASYACGGTYTRKPQIQTHTNKWWGMCPKEN